jgi:glycosyltransferase involved in cell wall biosynthesis
MQVNLARAFAERGYTVDLLLADATGPYLREVPSSVRVIELKVRKAYTQWLRVWRDRALFWNLAPVFLDRHPPRVLRTLSSLVQYLRQEQPTALLSAQHYGNITALSAVRLADVSTRLVITQRTQLSVYLQKGAKRRQRAVLGPIRRCYPWADDIVAVSNGVADDLAATASIPRQRITTIYNPVVTPELAEQAKAPLEHLWFTSESPPVILAAGRLHYQKDFPTLLKAFAQVRAVRPARLVILGEGEERNTLEALTRQLGLADDVVLPGFVDNPFAYMARSSVFVLSSLYEGLPAVLIQSMACGCPVVSTNCPSGPAEILGDGTYGPLVPAGDDTALAKAILTVLATPPDCEKLRARASRFSQEQAVERYLEVLCGKHAQLESL